MILFSEILRRDARMFLKEFRKIGIVLEIKPVSDLRDTQGCIYQQAFCFQDDPFPDHLPCRNAQHILAEGIQIIRRHIKQRRIFLWELYFHEVLLDKLPEILQDEPAGFKDRVSLGPGGCYDPVDEDKDLQKESKDHVGRHLFPDPDLIKDLLEKLRHLLLGGNGQIDHLFGRLSVKKGKLSEIIGSGKEQLEKAGGKIDDIAVHFPGKFPVMYLAGVHKVDLAAGHGKTGKIDAMPALAFAEIDKVVKRMTMRLEQIIPGTEVFTEPGSHQVLRCLVFSFQPVDGIIRYLSFYHVRAVDHPSALIYCPGATPKLLSGSNPYWCFYRLPWHFLLIYKAGYLFL